MNPFWSLLLVFFLSTHALARVRKVEVTQDQIVTVRTALGIATIIQVPDRPNSIVVGDQAAFKVEYLDQAITIKPLRGGAKSNLYVYTDYRRFNVQLITGADASADYVVYRSSALRASHITDGGGRGKEHLKNKARSLSFLTFHANLALVRITDALDHG